MTSHLGLWPLLGRTSRDISQARLSNLSKQSNCSDSNSLYTGLVSVPSKTLGTIGSAGLAPNTMLLWSSGMLFSLHLPAQQEVTRFLVSTVVLCACLSSRHTAMIAKPPPSWASAVMVDQPTVDVARELLTGSVPECISLSRPEGQTPTPW